MKNIQYRTHQSYFCEDKEQCWTLFWAGGAKQRGAERESGRLRNHTHTLLWLWRNCCQATAPLQAWDLHMQQCYWQQLASGLWQLKGNLEAASRKALLRFASALISVWEIGLTFMLSCQFQCPKPGPALKATHPCETNKRPWHVVPIYWVLKSHFYKEQKKQDMWIAWFMFLNDCWRYLNKMITIYYGI